MAGRGRGRGRGSLSFSVETLGFGRGESLPGAILQPPPLFPPLEFKPLPLSTGEEQDYLLALKQEIRNAMKESQYFIKPMDKKRDIERYSDKYTLGYQENGDVVEPDWRNLPAELKPGKIVKRKKVKAKAGAAKPNISLAKKPPPKTETNITEKLEELEKKEEAQDDEKPGGTATEEGQEQEEEEDDYYEEEMEEETDYNLNYFDNGEDFGMDEDDDLEEGPVY